MITNTDATLYHRIRGKNGDSWQKVYLPAVWWYENIHSSITTNGMKTANAATNVLTVRIPDIKAEVRKEDYLVKGNCDIEMETIRDLKGIEYFCVTGANYNSFGSSPHIKVVAQ